MRQVLEARAHLAQPRHLDVGQHPQHLGLPHDGLLSARQLCQPLQQRRFGGYGCQNPRRRLQTLSQEALRRGGKATNARENRSHALVSRAAGNHARALDNRARLASQTLEVVSELFDFSLRLGDDRPQRALRILENAPGRRPLQHRRHAACPGLPSDRSISQPAPSTAGQGQLFPSAPCSSGEIFIGKGSGEHHGDTASHWPHHCERSHFGSGHALFVSRRECHRPVIFPCSCIDPCR